MTIKRIIKTISRKMEAEKVDSRVCNIKVYVDGKSVELQKKLFAFGCKWQDGRMEVCHTDLPFLYVNQEGIIQGGWRMCTFIEDVKDEENVDKVLEMTPISEEECEFTDYDLVLGRDRENQEWNIDFFVRLGEEPYKYECFRDSYKYCIPYIGNEHLVGLTKKK